MVSLYAPRLSVAPDATATVAASARRFAAPSASVPAWTETSPAAVPFSVELPPRLKSVPAPRLAFTVAPVS